MGTTEPRYNEPFTGVENIYFDIAADFLQVFKPNSNKIMEELPNFTDVESIIQFSEVVA